MTETCVRIYDDVVSKEWCKETIDMFEKTKKGFDPKNPDKKIDERYENPNFKDVKSLTKSFTEICLEEFENETKEWFEIKKHFLTACQQHFLKFAKELGIEKHHLAQKIDTENVHFKKYEANGLDVFKNHVDVISTGPLSKRFLVFIMYLSDVEEGGETSIPRYNIKCKPKAGRLLMFPPFWTHPHQGEQVIKGTKYIMMTYLHMGEEKKEFNLNQMES